MYKVEILKKLVNLNQSKNEKIHKLEQMRAMENNLIIKVGLCDSSPLGIDTKEDLVRLSKEMN